MRGPARGDARPLSATRSAKFIYTVPSFQNPGRDDVAAAAAAARGGAHEREPSTGGQPHADCCTPRATRRRSSLGSGVTVMYLGTFSKILSPGSARLGGGAAAGAREDQPRQAGHRPVHVDAVAADGAGVLRGEPLARRRVAHRGLPRGATRCSTLADHFPRQAEWTRRRADCSSGWRTSSTDLLARALLDSVAFVPGEAAFLDGRGRNAMRLNYSGNEDAIREGIRPIGEVVTEQVELYGTLTGEHQAVRVDEPPAPTVEDNVCLSTAVRTLASGGGREPGRGAEGRSLERQVSLRSGARRGRARAPRPRRGGDGRGPGPDRAASEEASPDVSRVREARRGRHGAGTARDPRHPLHGLACSRACAPPTRCSPST